MKRLKGENDSSSCSESVLTTRQIEILLLAADGLTQKEIAEELNLSVHTIDYHIRKILIMVNATNLTHAIVKSIINGDLNLEPPT